MFDEIGEKLKGLAKWIFAIGTCASVILTAIEILAALELTKGRGTAIIASLVSCVLLIIGSFLVAALLYAFGTITNTYMDISRYIQNKERKNRSDQSTHASALSGKYNPNVFDNETAEYDPEFDELLKKSKNNIR